MAVCHWVFGYGLKQAWIRFRTPFDIVSVFVRFTHEFVFLQKNLPTGKRIVEINAQKDLNKCVAGWRSRKKAG